jgi:hypothetical protein
VSDETTNRWAAFTDDELEELDTCLYVAWDLDRHTDDVSNPALRLEIEAEQLSRTQR